MKSNNFEPVIKTAVSTVNNGNKSGMKLSKVVSSSSGCNQV